jgi:hypothetical protein
MTSNTLLSKSRLNKYIEDSLLTQGNFNEFIKEYMAESMPVFNPHPIINSTTVFVGDMGLSQRISYSSTGDGVNLVARLKREFSPCYIRNVLGPFTTLQINTVTNRITT